MGVILSALGAMAIALGGGLLVALVERRLLPAGAEPGPAQRAVFRARVRPGRPDPWLYAAGPVLAFIGVSLAAVVLPFSHELVAEDLGIGVFYFIIVVDFVVVGITLGGWGADTPNGVEACYRVVAQLVAYVVPLGLAVLGPIMMARSLSTVDIVEAQDGADLWYLIPQPLGFALYVVTAWMQTYRAPFLEPFAARIAGGVLSQYGGWAGLLWRLTLSALLFVVAAMGAVLFLGGYSGPWLPGPAWMLIKTLLVLALLIVLGSRLRLRSTADALSLSWKVLIPLGLANVLLVGALILLDVGQEPFPPPGSGGGG